MLKAICGIHDDQQRHVRMLQATEFGALSAINPHLARSETQGVPPARNQILFAGEARNPEGMDHIRRQELQMDAATHRDVYLVRCEEDLVGMRIEIGDLPPPLIPADLYFQ